MAKRNSKRVWVSDEFVGLMDRVRKELNLPLSDRLCSQRITNNYLNFLSKKKKEQEKKR